ncbi:MAG: hypothetical protein QY332_12330 [Anaerolineales bacterium]|nr:MAG: hypothetical protein QY332_12330 [Anaerolineales bacterium]
MKHRRNWIIGIVLSATAGMFALQNIAAPVNDGAIPDLSVSKTESVTEGAETYDGCYFVWAYRDDIELTTRLDAAVKAINPAATANATLFGEDCVYADGQSTFGAMQTDFHVRLPVDDLTNEPEMGKWIAGVMEIILQIPREQMQGPNYGFVEFRFEKNKGEHIAFRVPIQRYQNEAQGTTGAELFRLFYNQP